MAILHEFGGKRVKNSRCLELTKVKLEWDSGHLGQDISPYRFTEKNSDGTWHPPTMCGCFWFKPSFIKDEGTSIHPITKTYIFELGSASHTEAHHTVGIRFEIDVDQIDSALGETGSEWTLKASCGAFDKNIHGGFSTVYTRVQCVTPIEIQMGTNAISSETGIFHKVQFYISFHSTDLEDQYFAIDDVPIPTAQMAVYQYNPLPSGTISMQSITLLPYGNKAAPGTTFNAQISDLYVNISDYIDVRSEYFTRFGYPQTFGLYAPRYLGAGNGSLVYKVWNTKMTQSLLYMRIINDTIKNLAANQSAAFSHIGDSGVVIRKDVCVTSLSRE